MRNLILLLIAASQIRTQIAGGYSQSDICLNVDNVGLPVNLIGLQSEGIQNFFHDQTNKTLELVHLATQVVAGLNYRVIFKLVNNGQTFWIGIIAYRNLQRVVSITKFIQTNDVNDIFTLFRMTDFTEDKLKAVQCGNLFDALLFKTGLIDTHVDPIIDNKKEEIHPVDNKDFYTGLIIPAPVEEEKQPQKVDKKEDQEHGWKDSDHDWQWDDDKKNGDFDWNELDDSLDEKKHAKKGEGKHHHGQRESQKRVRKPSLLVGATAYDGWNYDKFESTHENKH